MFIYFFSSVSVLAVILDHCDIRGYIAWTLMDNFEWAAGFTERFGLHYIDMNDPEKKRVPKASAKCYATIVKNNGFPQPVCENETE